MFLGQNILYNFLHNYVEDQGKYLSQEYILLNLKVWYFSKKYHRLNKFDDYLGWSTT